MTPSALHAPMSSTTRSSARLPGTTTCFNASLGSILVSPRLASVSASGSQTFTANALSTCGTDITNLTHFWWRLSSTTVGSLGSDTGPTVVYTACVAPMDGVLHLVGILGNVNLSVNATIRIGGGSFGDLPGSPAAPVVGNLSTTSLSREAGVVLVGVLLFGGIFVVVWEMRSRPRQPGP